MWTIASSINSTWKSYEIVQTIWSFPSLFFYLSGRCSNIFADVSETDFLVNFARLSGACGEWMPQPVRNRLTFGMARQTDLSMRPKRFRRRNKCFVRLKIANCLVTPTLNVTRDGDIENRSVQALNIQPNWHPDGNTLRGTKSISASKKPKKKKSKKFF